MEGRFFIKKDGWIVVPILRRDGPSRPWVLPDEESIHINVQDIYYVERVSDHKRLIRLEHTKSLICVDDTKPYLSRYTIYDGLVCCTLEFDEVVGIVNNKLCE